MAHVLYRKVMLFIKTKATIFKPASAGLHLLKTDPPRRFLITYTNFRNPSSGPNQSDILCMPCLNFTLVVTLCIATGKQFHKVTPL